MLKYCPTWWTCINIKYRLLMMNTNDIKQNLLNLGLEDSEADVYIALSNKESASILELSKVVNIPRTTVYRLCEKLVEKKFAEWIVDSIGNKIKVLRPSSLDFLIKEEKQKLEVKENALQTLQSMIPDVPLTIPKTQVRYYQGKEGMKQVMWNALKAKKETVGYSVYGRREVVGDQFNNKWVQEFKARKLSDRTVINEEGLDYLITHNHSPLWHQQNRDDIRFLPNEKFCIKGDVTIYNNIYAVCFWREGEVVAFEIENPYFVKNQKSIFEILWEIAKPIKDGINISSDK
jgi:predicted transcriptional regulator